MTAESVRISGIGYTPITSSITLRRPILVADREDDRTYAERVFDEAKRLIEEYGFRLQVAPG